VEETVIGPIVGGYYVTAYAFPGDGADWLSYYKICLAKPPSYWEAQSCVYKGAGARAVRGHDTALAHAIQAALKHAATMPPAAQLLESRTVVLAGHRSLDF
jgi:hypothetical protein